MRTFIKNVETAAGGFPELRAVPLNLWTASQKATGRHGRDSTDHARAIFDAFYASVDVLLAPIGDAPTWLHVLSAIPRVCYDAHVAIYSIGDSQHVGEEWLV
jgi:hypothetical protein